MRCPALASPPARSLLQLITRGDAIDRAADRARQRVLTASVRRRRTERFYEIGNELHNYLLPGIARSVAGRGALAAWQAARDECQPVSYRTAPQLGPTRDERQTCGRVHNFVRHCNEPPERSLAYRRSCVIIPLG